MKHACWEGMIGGKGGMGIEAQCTRNQDDGNVQTIRKRKGDRVKTNICQCRRIWCRMIFREVNMKGQVFF